MKAASLAAILLAALAVPAIAGPCDEVLPKVKEALQSGETAPETRTQVQDMVTQADQLCQAGNDQEAADVIAEAASLLQIE